jgi:nicotinamide mononucleotide transporter
MHGQEKLMLHPALEWAAAAVALTAVGLGILGKRATWLVWILSSLRYAVVFVQSRLWADALLQLVFVAAAVWGWVIWGRVRFAPVHLGARAYWLAWALLAVLSTLMQSGLRLAGGSSVWGDAVVTSSSLLAQTLMVQQKVEHWHFWLLANLCGVWLFWSQQLLATAWLYAVFGALALAGLRHWNRYAKGKPEIEQA